MLEISVAYSRYKYLGHEFLTWLWYMIEKEPEKVQGIEQDRTLIEVGNRIVFENRRENGKERVTIKGDEVGLEEGMAALKKGAMVTELNLMVKADEQQWQFSLKGESLSFVGLKTPRVGAIETQEDFDGAVLEKAYLYEKAIAFVDDIYKTFVKIRVSNRWTEEVVPAMRAWILGT